MIDIAVAEQGTGVSVVTPTGRLNMVSARQLTTVVTEVIDGGRPFVVVDLGSTDFMDSSGLGALVSGLKRARQAGGDLRLARPNAQVKAVLELTNLNRVLTVHESPEGVFRDR
jgi:anti-sigma B factor antagonist